jgi:hypothetical protein
MCFFLGETGVLGAPNIVRRAQIILRQIGFSQKSRYSLRDTIFIHFLTRKHSKPPSIPEESLLNTFVQRWRHWGPGSAMRCVAMQPKHQIHQVQWMGETGTIHRRNWSKLCDGVQSDVEFLVVTWRWRSLIWNRSLRPNNWFHGGWKISPFQETQPCLDRCHLLCIPSHRRHPGVWTKGRCFVDDLLITCVWIWQDSRDLFCFKYPWYCFET